MSARVRLRRLNRVAGGKGESGFCFRVFVSGNLQPGEVINIRNGK